MGGMKFKPYFFESHWIRIESKRAKAEKNKPNAKKCGADLLALIGERKKAGKK